MLQRRQKYLWLTILNKIPTWDYLQRRCYSGPRFCMLCKTGEESTSHIFIHYPYAIQVWKDLNNWIGHPQLWIYNLMEEGLKAWFDTPVLKNFRVVPFITLWGLWLEKNKCIFEGTALPSFQTSWIISIV